MADSILILSAKAKAAPPARRAFTLVEILVALGLSGFVLAGVLTATLQLMRSGARVTQYAEMDTQVRRTFEQLGIDLKAASALIYNSASDVTVTVEKSDGTTSQFTYAWDSTTKIFYRVAGDNSAVTSGRISLLSGVSALAFSRRDASGATASTDGATKRLGLAITLYRSATGAARTTSTAATTFTLRNKPIS